MLSVLKKCVERTFLADIYRQARDRYRFSSKKFLITPEGYEFAGRRDMQNCSFEKESLMEIKEKIEQADIFVDIGANIGYYTCLACSMGKYVIAVEPSTDNLRYLYANIQQNGWGDKVEVYPGGVSERSGIADLYGAGTGASLVPGWAGVSDFFKKTISLSTLDILLGERFQDKKLFIKIDVEGHELSVLKGALRVMENIPKSTWIVEITLLEHRKSKNLNFLKTFELFMEKGYEIRETSDQNKIISFSDLEEYYKSGIKPRWGNGNYLFLKTNNIEKEECIE